MTNHQKTWGDVVNETLTQHQKTIEEIIKFCEDEVRIYSEKAYLRDVACMVRVNAAKNILSIINKREERK